MGYFVWHGVGERDLCIYYLQDLHRRSIITGEQKLADVTLDK
jgi:hypothetical protein